MNCLLEASGGDRSSLWAVRTSCSRLQRCGASPRGRLTLVFHTVRKDARAQRLALHGSSGGGGLAVRGRLAAACQISRTAVWPRETSACPETAPQQNAAALAPRSAGLAPPCRPAGRFSNRFADQALGLPTCSLALLRYTPAIPTAKATIKYMHGRGWQRSEPPARGGGGPSTQPGGGRKLSRVIARTCCGRSSLRGWRAGRRRPRAGVSYGC